jgi:hypothetical protein
MRQKGSENVSDGPGSVPGGPGNVLEGLGMNQKVTEAFGTLWKDPNGPPPTPLGGKAAHGP